ncbi:hypothetical protein FACS1894199_12970 [Bacteroidia bacterium]|nr:hypothetical protein FACS1894199_12970 [Bacteroidia bacterium]
MTKSWFKTSVETGHAPSLHIYALPLIAGLTGDTIYYVRAYAISSGRFAYGDEVTFTTLPCLGEGFEVDASAMLEANSDGVSGTITNTGGSNYRVRSMGGVWWMIQNADKDVATGGDCTYDNISRGADTGRMYFVGCAQEACPTG